ncbi:MAG: HAD-IA family hydrolase [Thiotrichales bacterium]
MNLKFDLLVFDWDGTLMDSESHIVACLALALREVGLPPRDTRSLRQVIGLGLREAMLALLPEAPASTVQEAVDAYRRHFLSSQPTPSELFPGVLETLDTLRAAGFRMAVATGKSRRGLDKVLDETALHPYFEATRCADETRSKPDPLMLRELLDELAVDAGRALMIGDTEFDLAMAAAMAMPRIGVGYGVHERDRLLRHAPLAILEDIRELVAWLGHDPAVDAGLIHRISNHNATTPL